MHICSLDSYDPLEKKHLQPLRPLMVSGLGFRNRKVASAVKSREGNLLAEETRLAVSWMLPGSRLSGLWC